VYLYASNSIDSIKITNIANDEYNMIIPAPEMFELISYKMNIAYDYFSKINIKGILKIDDNTNILYPEIIEHDLLDIIDKYDYIGLEEVKIDTNKSGYLKLFSRTTVPLLGNIYHKLDIDISYFAGPFYYLSPAAIKQVALNGLVFGYEDVSVGYVMCKNPLLKRFLWNFKDKGVSWINNMELDAITN
jgi:hypothetical protein